MQKNHPPEEAKPPVISLIRRPHGFFQGGGNRGHRLTTNNHIILRMEHSHLVRVLNPGKGGGSQDHQVQLLQAGRSQLPPPSLPQSVSTGIAH